MRKEIIDIFVCLSPPNISFAKDEMISITLVLTILVSIAFVIIYRSESRIKYKLYLAVIITSCIIFLSIFILYYQAYLNELNEYNELCKS